MLYEPMGRWGGVGVRRSQGKKSGNMVVKITA